MVAANREPAMSDEQRDRSGFGRTDIDEMDLVPFDAAIGTTGAAAANLSLRLAYEAPGLDVAVACLPMLISSLCQLPFIMPC
jgi:hypothetical protein